MKQYEFFVIVAYDDGIWFKESGPFDYDDEASSYIEDKNIAMEYPNWGVLMLEL